MALIKCPECGNQISDKAEKCPHCGIPSSYFAVPTQTVPEGIDYSHLGNILIAFDRDYCTYSESEHYITHRKG